MQSQLNVPFVFFELQTFHHQVASPTKPNYNAGFTLSRSLFLNAYSSRLLPKPFLPLLCRIRSAALRIARPLFQIGGQFCTATRKPVRNLGVFFYSSPRYKVLPFEEEGDFEKLSRSVLAALCPLSPELQGKPASFATARTRPLDVLSSPAAFSHRAALSPGPEPKPRSAAPGPAAGSEHRGRPRPHPQLGRNRSSPTRDGGTGFGQRFAPTGGVPRPAPPRPAHGRRRGRPPRSPPPAPPSQYARAQRGRPAGSTRLPLACMRTGTPPAPRRPAHAHSAEAPRWPRLRACAVAGSGAVSGRPRDGASLSARWRPSWYVRAAPPRPGAAGVSPRPASLPVSHRLCLPAPSRAPGRGKPRPPHSCWVGAGAGSRPRPRVRASGRALFGGQRLALCGPRGSLLLLGAASPACPRPPRGVRAGRKQLRALAWALPSGEGILCSSKAWGLASKAVRALNLAVALGVVSPNFCQFLLLPGVQTLRRDRQSCLHFLRAACWQAGGHCGCY